MALRLAKSLRRSSLPTALGTRRRPAPSEEIVDPPTDFYVVKDYEKNPFYMSMIHGQKPGYKKVYDPFKKHQERREQVWEPTYKGQLLDMGMGMLQIAFFIFLPLEFIIGVYWESRYKKMRSDPLGYNLAKPSEF